MALATHGSAQNYVPPTPEDVLPPLKSKIECIEIANEQIRQLEILIKSIPNNTDPNNPATQIPRKLYNAYQFVLNESAEPFFDMPSIMIQLYPTMHDAKDGTTTNAYGFYTKSWNKEYTDIVNRFKK
jgi:hypothetical protein